MADVSKCPPLSRSSVQEAHKHIEPYVHRTSVVTCETLDHIASTTQSRRDRSVQPHGEDYDATLDARIHAEARPKVRLFFKCENQQKIGAFKARGAFHALGRLVDEQGLEEVRSKGVCTHSSGRSL